MELSGTKKIWGLSYLDVYFFILRLKVKHIKLQTPRKRAWTRHMLPSSAVNDNLIQIRHQHVKIIFNG